jgi:hypothetical protein
MLGPMSVSLSTECESRIRVLFVPEEREYVRSLLREECGAGLPGLSGLDATGLDRFRFAVLKLSDGSLEKFDRALELAREDWRDLLMAAGFGHDVAAHRAWEPRRGADRGSATPAGLDRLPK